MTYLKSTLILTAAALTLAATPAYAGHHEEGDMAKTMTKAEMVMKCKSMMKMDDTAKAAAKLAHPEMAAKCKTMWKAGDLTDAATNSDAMIKTDAKMETKALIKSDSMMDQAKGVAVKEGKEMAVKEGKKMVTGVMHTSKVNDTVGEVIQADGEPSPQADGELLMSSGKQMTKEQLIMKDSDGMAKDNAIVVPTVNSNVVTTVACPVGTTAQPNGTCLITGNYNGG